LVFIRYYINCVFVFIALFRRKPYELSCANLNESNKIKNQSKTKPTNYSKHSTILTIFDSLFLKYCNLAGLKKAAKFMQ